MKKLCHSITEKDTNKLITNQQDILKTQKQFHETLYKSRLNDGANYEAKKFLQNVCTPSLNEVEKNILDKPLNKKEIKEALYSMTANKSPGNDGLPVELYRTFWNMLKDIYLESVSISLERGEFTTSQKQATNTLIKKEGTDEQYL